MELWDLYDSERNPLGRTHVRGEAFGDGEYYVCVEVWVRNSKGEFLIQKRHPDKKAGNQWEFAGGGTLAGETTLQSAVREIREETGIVCKEHELTFFATYRHKNYFLDLYLLRSDMDSKDYVPQPGETTEARWATEDDILQLIESGVFVYSVGVRFKTYRDQVRSIPDQPTFLDTGDLKSDELILKVERLTEAEPEKNWVPAYHFAICLPDGTKAGICDLRIGHNDKLYVGAGYHHLNSDDLIEKYGKDDANIWTAGLRYNFGDVTIGGSYAKNTKADEYDKSWTAGLSYKGADQKKPGSWGISADYRYVGDNVSFAPTYDVYTLSSNKKGVDVGVTWSPLLNTKVFLNYFWGKTLDTKEDTKTFFSRVSWFF